MRRSWCRVLFFSWVGDLGGLGGGGGILWGVGLVSWGGVFSFSCAYSLTGVCGVGCPG